MFNTLYKTKQEEKGGPCAESTEKIEGFDGGEAEDSKADEKEEKPVEEVEANDFKAGEKEKTE